MSITVTLYRKYRVAVLIKLTVTKMDLFVQKDNIQTPTHANSGLHVKTWGQQYPRADTLQLSTLHTLPSITH